MDHAATVHAFVKSQERALPAMPHPPAPRARWLFMSPRDIFLFLSSAKTDGQVAGLIGRDVV